MRSVALSRPPEALECKLGDVFAIKGKVGEGCALWGIVPKAKIAARPIVISCRLGTYPHLWAGNLTVVVSMPLRKYFGLTSCLLLALLFIAEWHLRPLDADPARSSVDRPIIQIHSKHKWPEAVVFDTSLPTIVPPPTAIVLDTPAPARPAREAFALAIPEAPAIKPAKAVKPARHPVRRARGARAPAFAVAGSRVISFRSFWLSHW